MLDTPTKSQAEFKSPEQIMTEVDANGFCLAEFSQDTKDILKASPIQEFTDGFYVDNPEHRRIFEQTQEIQSVIGYFKDRVSAQKISWNQILVCRVVEGGSKEKYRTHLDSHVYTIVVPLLMPEGEGEERGQLYVIPNYRKQPKFEISNFITKALAGKFRGERNYHKVAALPTYQEIDLQFGQFLVFNGMRCLHGNKANKAKGKRITLISHFADPFPIGIGSGLRFVRKAIGTRK